MSDVQMEDRREEVIDETILPKATVTFTRSSTKDGGKGYTVQAESGVTAEQMQEVMEMALLGRKAAEAAIKEDEQGTYPLHGPSYAK